MVKPVRGEPKSVFEADVDPLRTVKELNARGPRGKRDRREGFSQQDFVIELVIGRAVWRRLKISAIGRSR
jgi:hypothetical protein